MLNLKINVLEVMNPGPANHNAICRHLPLVLQTDQNEQPNLSIIEHSILGGAAPLDSPFVRSKINFLVVAWEDVFFWVWCLLMGNGGPTPSYGLSFRINTLAGLYRQVFEE